MHDRRNTNKQRGRVWAMSVLGNTKSNRYRKTHRVELDGTGRKFWHLSWEDLRHESAGEVSRGRSSEEVPVMGMERRAEESGSIIQTRLTGSLQYSETRGCCCDAANYPLGGGTEARGFPCGQRTAGCKPRLVVKGERK